MPTRKPSNNGGNIIGYFPSAKNDRSIGYEGPTEGDYCYILEHRKEVRAFEEQPFAIPYLHAGKSRRYTPDFRVDEDGQIVVVECKPAVFVDTEENRRKFAAAEAWCAERGYVFRVVTDAELHRDHLLANLRRLMPFVAEIDTAQADAALALLATPTPPATLDALERALRRRHVDALPTLFGLLFRQSIVAPLADMPLGPELPVALPERAGEGGPG